MQEASSSINLKNTPFDSNSVHITVRPSVITILFTYSKSVQFGFGPRSVELAPYSNYLFYDQQREYRFDARSEDSGQLVTLEIPIDALHKLIAKGVDELNFAEAHIFEQDRYHKMSQSSEAINECIDSIIRLKNPLMLEAKKFELLSHFFSAQDVQQYKCPFLNQKDNVTKVRQAKAFLIKDLQNSPTIKELSKMVGLNEHNLKSGFKEIYSKPIHTFLKDHKMITARDLIDSREYKINEVADFVGYSNVSHFIEAFKKKFGLTPKQYELRAE